MYGVTGGFVPFQREGGTMVQIKTINMEPYRIGTDLAVCVCLVFSEVSAVSYSAVFEYIPGTVSWSKYVRIHAYVHVRVCVHMRKYA